MRSGNTLTKYNERKDKMKRPFLTRKKHLQSVRSMVRGAPGLGALVCRTVPLALLAAGLFAGTVRGASDPLTVTATTTNFSGFHIPDNFSGFSWEMKNQLTNQAGGK